MEFLNIPVQLVRSNMKRLFILTGLDPSNDRFHTDILNAFLQNNDSTMKYELLSPQHQMFNKNNKAVLKPNVGILRTAWIDKYVMQRPAVVLIFIDLEWDDPNFIEKKTECESKINSLRQTINCSEVRFLLILIQKRINVTSTTHVDRINELCTTCNIKKEQIIPLTVSEGIKSAIISSIKKIVNDFSHQFYQAIHKKIRLRRVPENHVNLLIRNQFKLGYISEMRNDLASALNFYKLAFDKFTEMKISDEDKYEYLTVASIINYKICEIYFHRGNAIEAVTQFNRHEDKFMNRNKFNPGTYPSKLLAEIEYSKWCMKEYATFGHLFVEAANSVVLNTSVNPGKYFNSAGEFSEAANNVVRVLKKQISIDFSQLSTDILDSGTPTVFFGQRPWRPNVSLSDANTEQHARLALEKTVNVDYEQSIIYFKRALIYLRKVEKCSRQIRVAELQLASVLLQQMNFEGSLAIAEGAFRMMKDGINLCHSIFILLYELYFALSEPNKLLQMIFQMMNQQVMNSAVCKQVFGSPNDCAAHLFTVFNNIRDHIPPPLLTNVLTMLNNNERNQLLEKWQNVLNQRIRIDMTMLDSVIIARGYIRADSDTISDERNLICFIKIENKFIEDFCITKANFVFEIFSPTVTPQNPVNFFNYQTKEFVLDANDFSMFCLPLNPIPASFSDGCEVTLSTIELYMGDNLCLYFDNRHYNYSKFPYLDSVIYRESIRIIRSEYPILLKMRNDDNDKLLKDEISPIMFTLKNDGMLVISNISITFRTDVKPNQEILLYSDEGEYLPNMTKSFAIQLNPGEEIQFEINASFLTVGEKSLSADITAVLHTVNLSQFNKSVSLNFVVYEPFSTRVIATNNEANTVNYFLEGVQTKLELHLQAVSRCIINSYRFQLTTGVFGNCVETITKVINANESYTLKTSCSPEKLPSTKEMPIGQVFINWKRESSINEVTTVYNLGNIEIIKAPISLSVEFGGKNDCIIYKVVPVIFIITNLLNVPLSIKLTILRSDVFMFAGTNEISFVLEPGQTQHKNFAFVANVVGELPFPKVQIECPQDSLNTIENYVLNSLPKTILILPTSKSSDVQSFSRNDRHSSV